MLNQTEKIILENFELHALISVALTERGFTADDSKTGSKPTAAHAEKKQGKPKLRRSGKDASENKHLHL